MHQIKRLCKEKNLIKDSKYGLLVTTVLYVKSDGNILYALSTKFVSTYVNLSLLAKQTQWVKTNLNEKSGSKPKNSKLTKIKPRYIRSLITLRYKCNDCKVILNI